MKRSLTLSLCAITLVACNMSSGHADEIDITLEFSAGDWQVYAEVDTAVHGSPDASGSLGLSAVRILIDNVEFGTDGDGVTFPTTIGAINPVPTNAGDRAPVIQLTGGTLDIIYGQDIASGPIVGGVGVGGRDLIASGTYLGADPAFGSDGSLTSQGLFLTSTTAGGGNAIDPDDNNLAVNPPVGGVVLGDVDLSGVVDGLDIAPFVERLTSGTFQAEADINIDLVVDGLDVTPFVAILTGSSVAAITAVPEPSTMLLTCLFATLAAGLGRRRSC